MVTLRFACILFILSLTACGGGSEDKTNDISNDTVPPVPAWSVTQPADIVLSNVTSLNFYFDIKGIEQSELTIIADNLPHYVELAQTENQLSYLKFSPTYQNEPSAFSFPIIISDGENERLIRKTKI